ncbi:MAG: transposase [Nanoarchaeota archaeon]
MNKEYSDYLKFIDDALDLAKSLPRYFSKYSNKIYCNYQKFAIYVLMQKFKTTTRGIASILRASSDMRMHLGLTRVPSHSTIVRFVNKTRKQIHKLLGIRQAVTVGIDATGFELESKSYYYKTLRNSSDKQKTKQFMKLSISADLEKQLIMRYKIRKKVRNDTLDFINLVRDLNFKQVIADKGYDSRKNRGFVIRKLKAMPIIPVRSHTNYYGHIGNSKIYGKDYHQRSKVETIFSVIKRKYGSVLRSRSCATQKVELISKLITYNIDRMQYYLLLILRVAPEPLL